MEHGRRGDTVRRAVWAIWGLATAIALAIPSAQAADQPTLPMKPARTLDYEVSSGTFMSIAVSPDGKTIIFDMLGEIYSLPMEGGRAVPIANGMAFEVQPSFSPDGKWIAYLSQEGSPDWQVWAMRADGREPRQITFGAQRKFYLAWGP